MPKFQVSVPHDHPPDQVVSRLKDFSESIQRESPVELTEIVERWDDAGNLHLSHGSTTVKTELPTTFIRYIFERELPCVNPYWTPSVMVAGILNPNRSKQTISIRPKHFLVPKRR